MVSVSHTGSRSRANCCERIFQKLSGFNTKQRQKLQQRSSSAPKFVLVLFVALLTRVVFFLPFDKFSMDDFYYEDNGDQHYFIRHGFRDNFESDGKEGEKSTEIGKSGYNELSDKKENRRRSEREKDAQVQSIENKERSREASKPEENQAEKSREARNIEDDEDSSEDNSAEEESVDNLGKPLDTEDFQQVDEDQNSDDEERSDEAKKL